MSSSVVLGNWICHLWVDVLPTLLSAPLHMAWDVLKGRMLRDHLSPIVNCICTASVQMFNKLP